MNYQCYEARAQHSSARQGAVLFAVVVCLGVVTAFLLSWTKTLVLERQHYRSQQRLVQAQLIADSAVRRAAAALARDSEYTGETWTVPAEELDGRGATARIQVQPVEGEDMLRRIEVEADYPQGEHRARAQVQVTIELQQTGTAS